MPSKTAVQTSAAPAAIGPYSQAVHAAGLLFASGQIAFDPATMQVVAGGITEQTEQVCRNLAAVLAAAGAGFADVLKTTVFLQDLGDFAAMNAVYARYFAPPEPGTAGNGGTAGSGATWAAPARSTVQVAALPRAVLVEIELVAQLPREASPEPAVG